MEKIFGSIKFAALSPLTLVNAAMGIGKSNVMAHIPKFLGYKGVTVVIAKDRGLAKQLLTAFRTRPPSSLKLEVLDGCSGGVEHLALHAMRTGMSPLVVFHKPHATGHSPLWEFLPRFKRCLVLIDELDHVLTTLAGGMNSKIGENNSNIKHYMKLRDRNLFDTLREHSNVKVFGFSGTLHNVLFSKMPFMGYPLRDVTVVNTEPIESLYSDLEIVQADTCSFAALEPHMRAFEESSPDQKGILIFSCTEEITKWKPLYKTAFGREISAVEIIAGTEPSETELKDAKYVIGINKIGVGFDLFTLCGQEVGFGILFREFSDRASHPTSSNSDHALHTPYSSPLLQALARIRKSGKFIVNSKCEIKSMYKELHNIYDRIRIGKNECLWAGEPLTTTKGRFHQGTLIALKQNIEEKDEAAYRPKVKKVLAELMLGSGDFVEALEAAEGDPSKFDSTYWTNAIGCLWEKWVATTVLPPTVSSSSSSSSSATASSSSYATTTASSFSATTTASSFSANASSSSSSATATTSSSEADAIVGDAAAADTWVPTTKGGGLRAPTETDADVMDAVKERAEGICCHCGKALKEQERIAGKLQICHVQRRDANGPYTRDNLLYGHRHCDAMYDASQIIQDPCGGFWLSELASAFRPSVRQWTNISPLHVVDRWIWAMNDLLPNVKMTMGEFRAHLRAEGYTRRD